MTRKTLQIWKICELFQFFLLTVFTTPKELARWLEDNNASSFGSSTTTYDEWLKFIEKG